ncbi:MAG TPA: ATPase domain-containing protein [Pyrinomonadaceae bacterium]|jgi:circadian clock protein KaiC|nr:ATPase domain-containing protein [Pyrinomonadaceae bacterium]
MVDKISTGVAGLDEVLLGGIPANTISVIMGAPGTGKTILAEQLAFANATPEAPALYLSTLSEPLEKILVHGQTHSFFDVSKIGVSVFYEDLGILLRDHGIEKLPEIMLELILARRPKFVFIDSFKAINELVLTPQDRRTITYDLANVLSSYQCTSFLIGEYAQDTMTDLPVFAIADVILQLVKISTNVREERFVRVEKLRGSGSAPGLHAFSISQEGIEVFPRLVSPAITPEYSLQVERVNTAVPGLDDLIEKGFWRGSTTLVAGPTGSGKTIIGLHFICEGALQGEQGLYVGFQENPNQLARIMSSFGWQPEELINKGFELMYRSPVEMQLDSVTSELFQRVREGKIKRVVIDALGDLERCSIDRKRFSDFVYALTQWFAVRNVTCIMSYELTSLFEVSGISDQEVSNMSDNIILLRFREGVTMERTLRVIKTRGSAHDNNEHRLEITNKGIVISKAKK